MKKKKIVCISGMERSGTSMVSRIVNLLGVYLGGRDDLIMETEYNKKGCWENKSLLKISDEILARFGGDTHHMPDFPEGWVDDPRIADLEVEARKTIEREFSNKDVWGWKDPRCCLVMPFWQKLLPDMEYVICIRNPVDVGNSLVSLNAVSSYAEAARVWHMYTSNIIRYTAGKRRILVFYEDFMGKDSMQAIGRLAKFLGPEYVKRMKKASSEIETFITKGLQHHETPVMDTLKLTGIPLSIKAYYLALILLEKGGIESLGGVDAASVMEALSLYKDEGAEMIEELAMTKKKLNSNIVCKRQLEDVYASMSWRITGPLRRLVTFARPMLSLADRIKSFGEELPHSLVCSVLHKASAWVGRHPGFERHAMAQLRKYPSLKRKLQELSSDNNQVSESFNSVRDDVHCQVSDTTFALPLPSGRRKIYIYVDHTVSYDTNTGVQRVTRGVAASLKSLGEQVYFVKWSPATGQCVLISMEERQRLARCNGPSVEQSEAEVYPPNDSPSIPVAGHIRGENHWLIVPEVPHITPHQHPVTLDLLQWSRFAGLKTGFVFYDAIPLRREEFQDISDAHEEYMRQLLLADMVWPISKWSSDDLITFWIKNECASVKTMPKVEVIPLPGESMLCQRVKVPKEGEKLILCVGSIEPRKNQIGLIKAFQAYRRLHPESEWRLNLIGNLHPLVAKEVVRAQHSDKAISHLGHVSDADLDLMYRSCAFTVFPSIDEGFGLPILESLWYAKPCLCANFGAMAEVAAGGGCYVVDMQDQDKFEMALAELMEDEVLRRKLTKQIVSRPIDSWADYGMAIQARVETEGHRERGIGRIYYWIDDTVAFPQNTGIQRVARQLARELMEMGMRLVPVKRAKSRSGFGPVTREELVFFAQWNGPAVELWQDWIEPDAKRKQDWFFMPEVPIGTARNKRARLLTNSRKVELNCAAIFYDAIPWKMRHIYPEDFAEAHRVFMVELARYNLVLPISSSSQKDLINFFSTSLKRTRGLDARINAAVLPGEFRESPRVTSITARAEGPVTILCVGTVEPRKNHETLLQAFELASQKCKAPLRLILAGGSHSIVPELAERVRAFIARHPEVRWEEGVDDKRLRELYLACDFTVYPSIEEGFGLPVLESLWYAKPCVCANFGAMGEVAEGGGCLTVDVRNVQELAEAIQRMATDSSVRENLAQEAIARPFKTWRGYALEVAVRLAEATPASPKFTELPLDLTEIEDRAQAMNLAPRPKLSVCISTYNRAGWLAKSLENLSLLYPEPMEDVEILVCDNASTDNTPKVVGPYLKRTDFAFHRNIQNVGMLGNLRVTAHRARGEYIWILGDDDLLMPGAIERVMKAIKAHKDIALIYLNYAFTRIEDARTIDDFDIFFKEATPIVPAEADFTGPIKSICARNENFFTAIYTLVLRRDFAIQTYSQYTGGRPFSTMLTCIPTTYYVLHHMMEERGVWIGEPQIVVNMNVSWLKYAPLWILERLPEVYELAESYGASAAQVDRWRKHSIPGAIHFFDEIFNNDPLGNGAFFKPKRFIRRFGHLPEFRKRLPELRKIYSRAHEEGRPGATMPVSEVFPDNSAK